MLLFKLMIVVVVTAIIAFAWGLTKFEEHQKKKFKR